jgi:protein-S-isoprenylcysteine O-methyltransferase Ste14
MRLAPASIKSAVFVVIQFVCLIVIFLNVSIVPHNIYLILGIALFLFLGIWAIFIMKFNFNVAPDLVSNAKLVKEGPYKFIRHPMYTSVLGITICYILNDFSPLRILIFVILLINFILKLNYEENILIAKFSEYSDYKKSTKRLIPFIY